MLKKEKVYSLPPQLLSANVSAREMEICMKQICCFRGCILYLLISF